MENFTIWNFCTAFAKAYFGNPQILTLIAVLILSVGVSLRFHKLEKQIQKIEKNN